MIKQNFRPWRGCVGQTFILKGEKECDKRMVVYRSHLEKACEKALLKVLRMYNVSGKQLNGITSMYINNLSCVRAK